MKLNITGLKDASSSLNPNIDGTYAHIGARGGTEMIAEQILKRVNPDVLAKVNIIHSRVRDNNLSNDKHNILVLHDTWDDPENKHLSDEKRRKKFKKLIFVSNYQQATYNIGLNVPFADGIVMQNAIDPIEFTPEDKKSSIIRLIYHTTPHRGLELLVPVVDRLSQDIPNIHLEVFSSFKAYGWEARDAEYKELFNKIHKHPNMTYHGYQPNSVVREALKKAHIYAYPNIWPETSCISVIEAMSAGCNVVCPNFGALFETCANFATMYGFNENNNIHANQFINILSMSIRDYWTENNQNKLKFQKIYFDNYYNWELRGAQWNGLLSSLVGNKPQ